MAIKYDYSAEEANDLQWDDTMRLISLCARASRAAGCAMPDFIPQGAGAKFLLEAVDEGMELFEEVTRDDGAWDYYNDDPSEYINQRADNVVPIYYDSLWATWLGLKGYEYDNEIFGDELPRGRDDLEKIPQQDLYDMAYKIIADVIENAEDYGFRETKSNQWSGEV